MKNKKSFLFDERTEAVNILTNGFEDGKINYSKMYVVAKYLRESLGFGKIRLERELVDFCKKQDSNFNPIVEGEQIKKWVKSAMNYNLRIINSVFLTKQEIDFLKNIEVAKDRKILYVTLVLSKALKKKNSKKGKSDSQKESQNYYIRYSNFGDIIKLSKISKLTEIQLAKIFNKHKDCFKFYSPEKELIKLEYASPDSKEGYEISNLSNLTESYLSFFENIKDLSICESCKSTFEKNNNKQKRCKECSKKIKREQKKDWIKEARKKSKKL